MQVSTQSQEDSLEKEMATHASILAWESPHASILAWEIPHASILAWEIPWTEAWQAIVHGVAKSWTHLCD